MAFGCFLAEKLGDSVEEEEVALASISAEPFFVVLYVLFIAFALSSTFLRFLAPFQAVSFLAVIFAKAVSGGKPIACLACGLCAALGLLRRGFFVRRSRIKALLLGAFFFAGCAGTEVIYSSGMEGSDGAIRLLTTRGAWLEPTGPDLGLPSAILEALPKAGWVREAEPILRAYAKGLLRLRIAHGDSILEIHGAQKVVGARLQNHQVQQRFDGLVFDEHRPALAIGTPGPF